MMVVVLGQQSSDDDTPARNLEIRPTRFRLTVDSGDGLGENQFIARLRIRKFQKRLLTTKDVGVEFVAGGRKWLFRLYMECDGRWYIDLSLAEFSLPALPGGGIRIEAHRGKLGSAAPPSRLSLMFSTQRGMLIPAGMYGRYNFKGDDEAIYVRSTWQMTDWLMDKKPKYVDCDGTILQRCILNNRAQHIHVPFRPSGRPYSYSSTQTSRRHDILVSRNFHRLCYR